MEELKDFKSKYDSHITKENTILLKENVAFARNYQILPWYLNKFKQIENTLKTPRTNPHSLNRILKMAKKELWLKIDNLTNL